MTEPFISYAQHGEDVILWRALGADGPGYYVDVGAFDPTEDSVTRALYERGWRGMNIEPQPERLALFEEERPEDVNLCLAVGAADGRAPLYVDGPNASLDAMLATGDSPAPLTVEVRTLATVLRDHGVRTVDVLKVDVEGGEPDVIAGLDLEAVRPRVVVVEGMSPIGGRGPGDRAVDLLVAGGYRHCLFDGLNHYLTTDDSLVEALSVPANPTDLYERIAIARFREALAAREEQIAELADANLRLAGAQDATGAAAPAEAQISETLAAADRDERLRSAFTEHLVHPPSELFTELPQVQFAASDRLIDAMSQSTPEATVIHLYRAVLSRPPDPGGLAAWAEAVGAGADPLVLAEELAASDEALAMTPDHRRIVSRDIAALRARRTLEALADPGRADTGHTPAEELLVRGLHRACLGRGPTPDELEAHVRSLRAGVGREHLIRAFAHRPETWRHLFGSHRGGVRSRMWSAVGRLDVVDVVRDRVSAFEQAEVATLVALASDAGSPLPAREPGGRPVPGGVQL